MASRDDKKEKEDKESISIKEVRKDLYERVKNLAKETGKTVGEVTNDAFKVLLAAASETRKVGEEFLHSVAEGTTTYVQDLKSIEITGPELVKNNKKVTFKNIENLIFRNITETDFDSFVESIINVKTLEIPKEISKFKVLERVKYVDNFKFS